MNIFGKKEEPKKALPPAPAPAPESEPADESEDDDKEPECFGDYDETAAECEDCGFKDACSASTKPKKHVANVVNDDEREEDMTFEERMAKPPPKQFTFHVKKKFWRDGKLVNEIVDTYEASEPEELENYVTTELADQWGGGTYFHYAQHKSGDLAFLGKCKVPGAPKVPGTQAPASRPPPARTDASDEDDIPKDMHTFMMWQMKESYKRAEIDRQDALRREENARKEHNDLLMVLINKKQESTSELKQLEGTLGVLEKLGMPIGGREPTGAEQAIKVLESPIVQDLAKEGFGLLGDLIDRWDATKNLGREDVNMEQNPQGQKRKPTPADFVKELNRRANGDIPQDVLVAIVNEVLKRFPDGQFNPKQQLLECIKAIRALDKIQRVILTFDNMVIKGSHTPADAADYLRDLKKEEDIAWRDQFIEVGYDGLLAQIQHFEASPSLKNLVTYIKSPKVKAVLCEIIDRLKNPDKYKKQDAKKPKKKEEPEDEEPVFQDDSFNEELGDNDAQK